MVAVFFVGAEAANACAQPAHVIDAAVTRARLPIAAGALQSKTELVLRNIRFDTHPGTQFNVILERRDDPTKRAPVGMLSFYMTTKGRAAVSRTFDVTDELRQIAASAADLQNVDVVFEATTGRGGGNAEARFDSRSKVTVGKIELRIKE